MSTPLLLQNTATSVVVFLEALDGTAATGIAYNAVTVGIKKEGAVVFTAFTITNGTWHDLSNGFYMIDLAVGDTNTLGSLYFSVQGAAIRTALLVARVAVAATASPTPSPGFIPTTTPIFGYIYDQQGNPKANVTVAARTVAMPTVLHPVDQGIVLTTDFLTAVTDSVGFFTMNLVTGATVEFIIGDSNYRRTVLIPGSTSNLFDIP